MSSSGPINPKRFPLTPPRSRPESQISFEDAEPILKHLRSETPPPKMFRRLSAAFTGQNEKKSYAEELAKLLPPGTEEILQKCSLKELQTIEHIFNSPFRGEFNKIAAEPSKIREMVSVYQEAEAITQDMHRLLGESLTTELAHTLCAEIARVYVKVENGRDFLQHMAHFIDTLDSVQEIRPNIYLSITDPDISQVPLAQLEVVMNSAIAEPRLLIRLMQDMVDRTVPTNSQVLHEAIEEYYDPTTMRASEEAKERVDNSPCSLLREIHIGPITFHEDSDEILNFDELKLSTEILLFEKESLETYCIKVPLPLSGKMSITEARKRLDLLHVQLERSEGSFDFEQEYEARGLPPEDMKNTKNEHIRFVTTSEYELARGCANFNTTANGKPKGIFARHHPEMQAVIGHRDITSAIEAAKVGHVFRLESGALSLLPPEVAETFFTVGSFNEAELAPLKEAILNEQPIEQQIRIAGVGNSNITLTLEPVTISRQDSVRHFCKLTATLTSTVDGRAVEASHSTYYDTTRIPQHTVLKNVVNSDLLERDLLSARREFLLKAFV